MRRSLLPMYVASRSWAVSGRTPDARPLLGECSDLETADWPAIAAAVGRQAGPVRLRLLLSASLCRFAVLPWISDYGTARAIRRYVAEAFAGTSDVTEASHRVEIDWPAYGEPILAVAYPRSVVDSMRAAFAQISVPVATVECSIAPILARYGKRSAANAVIAYAEDDGVSGISIEDGRIAQIEHLPESGVGLNDLGVWSLRKRCLLPEGAPLWWIESLPKPEGFAGDALAVPGATVSSPGHALLRMCQ